MNYRINEFSGAALALAVLCFALCAPGFAQTTPPIAPLQTEQIYVISAKAGGVSQIEGDVKVKRDGAAIDAGQVLAKGDVLRDKDRVVTGTDGRAEILLNPGSYLRIGENAEFELTVASLDSLQIQIVRGSAIVEANTIGGDKGANVSIVTGQTTVRLEKAGLYRINATGAATEIYVWEGAARVGSQIVKSGRRITIGAGASAAAIAKFDRSNLDSLDRWSASRADELAKLNERLERVALESTLASNSWNSDSYFSSGYWVFDRRTRTWCYVPNYGASRRCCRAYNQNHSTAILVKKSDDAVSVVYTPRKSDDSALDVIIRKSSGDSSGSSSGKSDGNYDYTPSSPPPSKSNDSSPPSRSNDSPPPPTKSDPPPAPPSKSDDTPPPSKKTA